MPVSPLRDLASRAPGSGPAPTAVDRVAAAVRTDILSGALAPGTPLREESASAHYGVSRHTVRAAFQRLVNERLAVAEPYRGVRVTSFDRAQVIALQQLRAALEVEAVRIACERHGEEWPDSALAPARDALEALERLDRRDEPEPGEPGEPAEPGEAVEPGGPVDWLEVERIHADFHRALVAASESARIIESHAALGSELLLFLLHVRPHYTLASLIVEHRALLDEIPVRGPDALREHLEHSTRLLVGH